MVCCGLKVVVEKGEADRIRAVCKPFNPYTYVGKCCTWIDDVAADIKERNEFGERSIGCEKCL